MADLSPGSMLTVDGKQYMVQDSGSPWSLEMPDASTLRFEVHGGDHWAADPTTKNRSEIAMQGMIKDGTPINLSYGVAIEPGAANTASYCILGQLHQAQGTAVSGLGPSFSIGLQGEKMIVSVGYTDASGTNVTKIIFVDSSDIVRGHYYAINVQVTFDPNGNGHLVVTRDGLRLVSYAGPLGWQGEGGVYWKEGIYRATAPETMAADYTHLSLTTSTPTSPTGSGLQSYTQYDSAGHKSTSITSNAGGSTTTDKYDPSGNLIERSIVYADGSRNVYEYGVTGQNYVSDQRIYNAGGTLIQFVAIAADGSKTVTYYAISGQAYTSDQMIYNASGARTTAVYYNADGSTTMDKYSSSGVLTQHNVLHADGSRDVYDYGVIGKNYVSDHRVYNAAGTLTEIVGIGADGSKTQYDYAVTGKSYTSDQLTYNANGVLTLATYYNTDGSTTTLKYGASGALAQATIVHADGSHVVYDYGITGQDYVSDHRVYNAAGTLIELVGIGADGTTTVFDYAVTGKSYFSDQLTYNAGGVLTLANYYNRDGSTTTYKYGAGGGLTQATTLHTDGSHDVYDYGITGESYVSDHRVYNAAGSLTQFVGIAADGSKVVIDYAVSGKAYGSDQLGYNAGGILTLAIYHNNDGSTTTNKYSSSGSLTESSLVHADGSRDVHDYGIMGQSYVADYRAYNAGGTLTEFVAISASGAENVTAYAAHLTLTGAVANDVFNSFRGDSFVFKGAFGNDVVNNFHPGDASNHDVLEFASSAVADFSHLAMTQQGGNVVITIDAHDTVTLTGVNLAALTAHDFLFT